MSGAKANYYVLEREDGLPYVARARIGEDRVLRTCPSIAEARSEMTRILARRAKAREGSKR